MADDQERTSPTLGEQLDAADSVRRTVPEAEAQAEAQMKAVIDRLVSARDQVGQPIVVRITSEGSPHGTADPLFILREPIVKDIKVGDKDPVTAIVHVALHRGGVVGLTDSTSNGMTELQATLGTGLAKDGNYVQTGITYPLGISRDTNGRLVVRVSPRTDTGGDYIEEASGIRHRVITGLSQAEIRHAIEVSINIAKAPNDARLTQAQAIIKEAAAVKGILDELLEASSDAPQADSSGNSISYTQPS